MPESIYVYKDETFVLNVSFHADKEQAVYLNDQNGNRVLDLNIDQSPQGGKFEVTNTNVTPLIYTLFYYYKNKRSGREPWRDPSVLRQVDRDISKKILYITIRTEDGGDSDYNDSTMNLVWLNYNHPVRTKELESVEEKAISEKM